MVKLRTARKPTTYNELKCCMDCKHHAVNVLADFYEREGTLEEIVRRLRSHLDEHRKTGTSAIKKKDYEKVHYELAYLNALQHAVNVIADVEKEARRSGQSRDADSNDED